MKKYKILLSAIISFVCFFSFTAIVNAASLNISSSASTTSTTVDNSFTVTFNYSSDVPLGSVVYQMTYDTSKLQLTGGTQSAAPVYTGSEKSDSVTFTFKATAAGSATVNFKISQAYSMDEEPLSGTNTSSKTINIAAKPAPQPTPQPTTPSNNQGGNNNNNNNNQNNNNNTKYSSNNNLSSLSVSTGTLSPAFNKATTSYTVEVENKVTEIAIGGKVEDSKAYADGFKTYQLDEGNNKIEITVTAQDGKAKKYTITVVRKELDPIEVETEDGKKLKVVRKADQLKAPNEYFKESKVILNEKDEIPAFEYKVNNTTITLVGLKDDKGNVSLYRYEKDKYYPYMELKSNSIVLINVEKPKDLTSEYKEVKLKINDIEYTVYQKGNTSYYLIYGTNLETGETKLYRYEAKEKTLQLHENTNDNAVAAQEKRVLKRNYVIYALAGFLILTYLGILVSLISKVTKKKKKRERDQQQEIIRLQEEERLKKKERELRELEEQLRIKQEKSTKRSNKKEKSDKIEENVNKEKKVRKKKVN